MVKKGNKSKNKEKHSTKENKTVKIKRRAKKQTTTNYVPIIVGILAVIIIAVIIGTNLTNDGKIKDNNDKLDDTTTQDNVVVATVNGNEIYLNAIDEQYELLPPLYRQMYSKSFILNKTIEEELLIMEAEAKGLVVTEEEAETVINDIMMQQQITEEQLEEQLAQSQKTKQDLIDVYKKQILITNLLNDYVFANIEVSQEEVAEYYENNKNSQLITIPAQIKARHILVKTQEEAEEIMDLLEAGESFSELAQERSQDGSSVQGGDLGYFSEGMMVQPFNDLVFSMDVGDAPQIVETDFGFHIVEVTGVKDAQVKTLEEASEEITEILKQEKQESELMKYIKELWDSADIEIYEDKIVEDESPEAEFDMDSLNQQIIS
jgi:parvulin-like peptidyl-prolyl isomerase